MPDSRTPSPWIRRVLFTTAGLCLLGAGVRAYVLFTRGEPPDQDVLFFLIAAVVAVLADSITKFSFAGFEFERLKQRVDEISDVATRNAAGGRRRRTPRAAPSATAGTRSRPAAEEPATFEASVERRQRDVYSGDPGWDADPVAERAPSTSELEGARLTAKVTRSKANADLFKVDITCAVPRATPGTQKTQVAFFLHHTFPNPVRVVPVEGESAEVSVWSMGTFTVGALLENGTWLTLDLADADLSALTSIERDAFVRN